LVLVLVLNKSVRSEESEGWGWKGEKVEMWKGKKVKRWKCGKVKR
jgi:hypothetical protein